MSQAPEICCRYIRGAGGGGIKFLVIFERPYHFRVEKCQSTNGSLRVL